jgi:hypothetical protein
LAPCLLAGHIGHRIVRGDIMRHKLFMAALAAMLAVAPAFAQNVQLTDKQSAQLTCISDWLYKGVYAQLLANVYVAGETAGEDFDASAGAMDMAMIECQDKNAWTDAQTNLAAEIGMYDIIYEEVGQLFSKKDGVTSDHFNKLADVLNAMPVTDRNGIYDGVWRDDAALVKRVHDSLKAAGVPANDTTLHYGFLLLEANLIITYGEMQWAKDYP